MSPPGPSTSDRYIPDDAYGGRADRGNNLDDNRSWADYYAPGNQQQAEYYKQDTYRPPANEYSSRNPNDAYYPQDSYSGYSPIHPGPDQRRGYRSPSYPRDQRSPSYPREQREREWTPSAPMGGSSPGPHRPYIPPKFRRDSPATSSPRSPGGPRRARKEDFVPHLPSQEYIELSREPPRKSDDPVPKLLVLDLNGALLYRANPTGPASKRPSYPRPFLHNFLAYLMTPEPDGKPSPYEVLVWSSAQPQNVRGMVEMTFGKWCEGVWNPLPADLPKNEKRLLDVWARDKMNLGTDYHHNVQTTKDLRDVIANVGRYDERTVLLLDDSPNKATEQPWNHIMVPEYDKPEYMTAVDIACSIEELRERGEECDPTEFNMDNWLLAVVGILEAMAHQHNIPAWIRSGSIDFPEEDPLDTSGEVTLDTLPSSSTVKHWFKSPTTHAYWVKAGKAALERKGIPIEHGITPVRAPSKQGKGKAVEKEVTPRPPAGPVDYSVFRGLLEIARNVDNERQRDVLHRALDVLEDLGYAPPRGIRSGEPCESSEAHPQEILDPTEFYELAAANGSQPLRPLASYTSPPTHMFQSESSKSRPRGKRNKALIPAGNKEDYAIKMRKEARERLGETAEADLAEPLTLPVQYRPTSHVLKWLKRLTPAVYEQDQKTVATLQRKLDVAPVPPDTEAKRIKQEARKSMLDATRERLNLIVVPPTSRHYDTMLTMYFNLPERPEKRKAEPEVFEPNKR